MKVTRHNLQKAIEQQLFSTSKKKKLKYEKSKMRRTTDIRTNQDYTCNY